MSGDNPWGARAARPPSRKALERQEQEARAARRREAGGSREVTVEVARLTGSAARPSAGPRKGRPSRWASVEQAWRDEMRRLDKPEPGTG
jgi:hypothetical protein